MCVHSIVLVISPVLVIANPMIIGSSNSCRFLSWFKSAVMQQLAPESAKLPLFPTSLRFSVRHARRYSLMLLILLKSDLFMRNVCAYVPISDMTVYFITSLTLILSNGSSGMNSSVNFTSLTIFARSSLLALNLGSQLVGLCSISKHVLFSSLKSSM